MRLTSAFFAALLAMAICGNARAETHPLLTSKFTVQGGTFLPRIDFRAGVDASASLENPDFDLEGQLGVSNKDTLISGNFDWRFTPKWSAHLQYFEVGRCGTAVLQEDVDYQLSKHLGIGAKYQLIRLSLDIDKPEWTGNVELEYQGAYIYLSANWG